MLLGACILIAWVALAAFACLFIWATAHGVARAPVESFRLSRLPDIGPLDESGAARQLIGTLHDRGWVAQHDHPRLHVVDYH